MARLQSRGTNELPADPERLLNRMHLVSHDIIIEKTAFAFADRWM
jgi:hypothetical protein